ncbi:MAG TPA: amidase family protein, partial [Ferruginibacter sp.]|nr:amidase family protein [Ferruginibacter sp.]
QVGIFANNIPDAALLLEVMSGADDHDSTALQLAAGNWQYKKQDLSPKKYRIAYFKDAMQHPSLDPEIKEKILNLVNDLRSEGHTVTEIDFDLLDYVVPAYYVLTTAEASSNLGRYDGIRYGYQAQGNIKELTEFYTRTRTEGFGKEVQRRIMLGTFVLSSGYYDAYFTKAQQVRRLLVNKTKDIFVDFDAVIMPTSPTTAFAAGGSNSDPVAMYLADIFTVFANLTGIPGISVPLFKHSNGMPFGLQIMCKKTDELTLLEMAGHLLKRNQDIN